MKNLILVHMPGCQDVADFHQIATYAREIASDIDTIVVNNQARQLLTRKAAAKNPSLIFSPGNLLDFKPLRGKVYAGRPISKIEQMRQFERAGIPVPKYQIITKDKPLNASRLGPLVLVKGSTMHASRNVGTQLKRTSQVTWQAPETFSDDHPGRHGPMFAQQFIDTGEYSSWHRVLTLFGEPILAFRNTSLVPRCSLNATDEELAAAVIRAERSLGQTKEFVQDADLLAMARSAFRAFPDVPLQACDIIRERGSNQLYLLEINPGGNTWMFSRTRAAHYREELGVPDISVQFDAFRTSARILVEKTRLEAE